MKAKFIEFLKSQNIYEAFEQNLKADHGAELDEFIDRHVNEPHILIAGAFDWENSPQGHFYWFKINDQWHRELEEQL